MGGRFLHRFSQMSGGGQGAERQGGRVGGERDRWRGSSFIAISGRVVKSRELRLGHCKGEASRTNSNISANGRVVVGREPNLGRCTPHYTQPHLLHVLSAPCALCLAVRRCGQAPTSRWRRSSTARCECEPAYRGRGGRAVTLGPAKLPDYALSLPRHHVLPVCYITPCWSFPPLSLMTAVLRTLGQVEPLNRALDLPALVVLPGV